MITLTLVVCGLWLLVALYKFRACSEFRRLQPKPRPTILTHKLSDRDSLVYVEKDGQFWVGLYSEGTPPREEEQPDWYRSLTQRG